MGVTAITKTKFTQTKLHYHNEKEKNLKSDIPKIWSVTVGYKLEQQDHVASSNERNVSKRG